MGIFRKILTALLKPSLDRAKGKGGERKVSAALKKAGCLVLDDLYFPKGDGSTAQIDHVAIAPSGIYCVESKNYGGRIVGDRLHEKWVQYLGGKETRFYSPLRQNQTHVALLRKILGTAFPVFSLVVFVGDNAPWGMEEVLGLKEVPAYFLKKEGQVLLTPVEVSAAATMVVNAALKAPDERAHVREIKKKRGLLRHGICPRCETRMVRHSGPYGDYWKCPKAGCGYVVSLKKAKEA